MEEYFYDTVIKNRDFRGIGLYLYNNNKRIIERHPIKNIISDSLFRLPFDYFKDYLKIYFSDKMIKELKENKIDNYNGLIIYYKKSF